MESLKALLQKSTDKFKALIYSITYTIITIRLDRL